LKDVVRETLEGGRCTAKAKGHHQELTMSFMSAKINIGNINLFHINSVILETKIKFGKEMSAFEIIQKIVNEWNGELICDGYFVESVKAMTNAPSALFF
jgi:hypothetical protein